MALPSPLLKSYRTWGLALAVMLLVINGMVIGSALLTLKNNLAMERAKASLTAENLSLALSANLQLNIHEIEITLDIICDAYQRESIKGKVNAAAFNAFMSRRVERQTTITAIRVTNADGDVLYGTDMPKDKIINYSDRDYFKEVRAAPSGTMIMAAPMIGRITQKRQIAFAKRLEDANGKFAGVVVIPMGIDTLTHTLAATKLGPHDTVALLSNSQIIVRYHPGIPSDAAAGKALTAPALLDLIKSGKTEAPYHAVSGVDHVLRTLYFRKIGTLPLNIVVGLSDYDYLSEWRHAAVEAAAYCVAFMLLTILVGGSGYLRWREYEIANRALRATEAKLWVETARMKQLLRTSSDGIHILDDQGNLIMASDSFYRSLGYSQNQPPPLTVCDWDAQWSPEQMPEILKHLLHRSETFETRHRRTDGTFVDVEVSSSGVALDGMQYLYCSSRDITTRKAAEAKLIEANAALDAQAKKLQSVNAELEQFAYVASHDLRQPLRMISSYLELIKMRIGQDFDDELKMFFAFAIDGAKRLDRLILDLLDYSRTGRDMVLEPVSLSEIVTETLADQGPLIHDGDGQITIAPNLPVVLGTKVDLSRLFQNLIGNALKYHPADRRPQIDIGWRDDGENWLIWVKDNGIGIAASDYDRAFMVFQRLVPKNEYEGSGIGLAICKKVVDRLGGKIWIESTLGVGSTFFVSLPKHET